MFNEFLGIHEVQNKLASFDLHRSAVSSLYKQFHSLSWSHFAQAAILTLLVYSAGAHPYAVTYRCECAAVNLSKKTGQHGELSHRTPYFSSPRLSEPQVCHLLLSYNLMGEKTCA